MEQIVFPLVRRQKKYIKEFIFILSALLLTNIAYAEPLFWPKPPEKAKIEYQYSFSKPEDININKKAGGKIFDFIFGKSNAEIGAVARPQGIASKRGVIYVTDTAQGCVHVFNENKKEYFNITKTDKDNLQSPVGVVADANGKIYVTDSKLQKVFMFNPNGEYAGELGKSGFVRPTGIAIGEESGKIYVVDTLKNSIDIFGQDGSLDHSIDLKTLKGINHPTYIAVDRSGDLYLVDSLNFRCHIISKEGKIKKSFGKIGRAPGYFSMPKAIALDSDGNAYVTDSSFDNVQIFNQKGELLLFFGESGNNAGEFWVPAGISIDENDRIFVADSYNGRIQVFRYLK